MDRPLSGAYSFVCRVKKAPQVLYNRGAFELSGARRQNWTADLVITNDALYHWATRAL